MSGSTFIQTDRPEHLAQVAEDLEFIDELTNVEMAEMLSLDFTVVCSRHGVKWGAEQPAVFDEALGLAIVPVSQSALAWVLANRQRFDESQQGDLDALQGAVSSHGASNWYEVATF